MAWSGPSTHCAKQTKFEWNKHYDYGKIFETLQAVTVYAECRQILEVNNLKVDNLYSIIYKC